MRIGIDGRRNHGSGIGRVTSNLIEGLLEFDCTNDYFIFVNKGDKKFIERCNIEKIESEIPFFSKRDLYELPALVKKAKIDLFISPQFYVSPFIDCPNIKMVHDLWPLLHPEWIPTQAEFISNFGKESFVGVLELVNLFKKTYTQDSLLSANRFIQEQLQKRRIKNTYLYMIGMMAFTLNTASRIIVPSLHTKKEIDNVFPEVSSKVDILPNFPAPVFSINRKKATADDYLLHVSKWEPRKNILALIKAVSIVRSNYKKCKLVLVGDTGYRQYGKRIMDIITSHPYKDFVSYVGVVDDNKLSQYYHDARLFVFPSLYEGFGIPVLEAMASGLPVISSTVSALPEVCKNAALLVDPRKPNEIAKCIVKLLSDKELYRNLQEKGLARAKQFDRPQIINEFISIIEKITKIRQRTTKASRGMWD
jgi:glycosyltransferase involved in cell wall biosynthesis